MKTIGLIGGMSWESTIPYYRQINEAIRKRLGGLHSAKILLYSVDFHEIEQFQHTGDWSSAGEVLSTVASTLESAGADFLLLCTNTMHKVAPAIEAAIRIPLLHIVEPTAEEIHRAGFQTVGLLGTRFTMEEDFYKERLRIRHGFQVLTPEPPEREIIHRIIFEELCVGKVTAESLTEYRRIMAELVRRGAEAIILGCTEISLLVGSQDCQVPLFDTTSIHARKAVEWAIPLKPKDVTPA